MIWSPERIAKLIKLRAAGMTEPRIASRLGTTRNSVASKMRRLGLGPVAVRQARRAAKPKPKGKRAQLQIGVSLMVGRLPKQKLRRHGDPEPRDARTAQLIAEYPPGCTRKPAWKAGICNMPGCREAALKPYRICGHHLDEIRGENTVAPAPAPG